MKRITNILSYLWLLLLLLVAACSDLEEITTPMQGEEEVELTIQTNVPALGGSTRTAPTENITSITALAFDSDKELVKVVTETFTPSESPSISGTYTIKVPVRTRRIHFIAKNDATFDVFSTEADYGKSEETLLKDLTSDKLHYWGMLDFEDATALKSGGDVTLIRNMAKLTLTLPEGTTGHIAGFLNYNTTGTIVPYIMQVEGENEVASFGYQTTTNHALPTNVVITSDVTEDRALGTEHYLFEEYNKKSAEFGDVGDLVYVICKINELYYKIAFKPSSSSEDFYYVIRNCVYNITIVGNLDTKYGVDNYADAINASPINDTEVSQVPIEFNPTEVSMFLGETGSAVVTIPEGITELNIGYPKEFFGQGGLSFASNGNTLTPTEQQNSATTSAGKEIWVDTYTVSGGELDLTITLLGSIQDAVEGIEVQFIGSGVGLMANNFLTIDVLKRDNLTVTPTTQNLLRTAGSQFTATVVIPTYSGYDDHFNLQVGDADGKYTVTPPEGLTLNEGVYEVAEGSQYTFTFTLNDDGNAGDIHTIDFTATSEYHVLTGTTTVTLVVPDQDSYEIWVGDNAWTGDAASLAFFDYEGTIETGTSPTGFESDFYDTGANDHRTTPMLMGSDDSFTFTIPEDENESRWLTMLLANDNDGDTPSINLLKDGVAWTTSADANATSVEGTYNFGNGEIGTAGRLIRYELPAGTYTLQGSDAADYLLYYMRVTTEQPTMTDVAQPAASDYCLAWSGGTYANTTGKGYLKISDEKHIVDEDNLTHTVALAADNSLATSINLSSSLSAFDLNVETTRVTFTATDSNGYSTTTTNQNLTNQTNGSCVLTTYNAGNYTLTGTINSPTYKYSAFYDKLQLKPVEYEVKSPIKPGLYNSMDGSVLDPVEGFTSMDAAWAIGFLMPSVVPNLTVEPANYKIGISIPNWTISDEDDARGLGVTNNGSGNYTLETQDGMYHPREGWTYKIKWASIAGESITPSLTDEDDTDHYFTYKGTIGKSVSIPTPYTEIALDIALDFNLPATYNDAAASYDNMIFGVSNLYLTATISEDDATTYSGQTVNLQGAFSNGTGNNVINWSQSRKDGAITTNDDGTNLQFTIQSGVTSYNIRWVFVRNNSDTTDAAMTYTISNNQGYSLSGETSVILTIHNSATIFQGSHQFTTVNDVWTDFILNEQYPIGTTITLNFASNTQIKLCDTSIYALWIPTVLDSLGDTNYGDTSNIWMTIPAGDLTFTVNDEITLYENGNENNSVSLSSELNGLKIESGTALLQSITIAAPPSALNNASE